METVEQRLQVLERQLRYSQRANRVFILAIIALVGITGATGDSPQASKATTSEQSPSPEAETETAGRGAEEKRLRTIQAERFVLLDREGRSRATITMREDGPVIRMFDPEGQERLELSHTASASGLRLFDAAASRKVSLLLPHKVADHLEQARLEIRSGNGKSSIRASGLSVDDANDEQRLILSLINGNFPVLGISRSGRSGAPSVAITPEQFALHDAGGFSLFSVSAGENGRSVVSMRHPDHERSLDISMGSKERNGPVISFSAPANADGTGGRGRHLELGLQNNHQAFIRVSDGQGPSKELVPSGR